MCYDLQPLEPRRLFVSTIAMYTYAGDANLDGEISAEDYSVIDYNVVAGAGPWYNGDFNYDGVITADDYSVIDNMAPGTFPWPLPNDFSGTSKNDVITVSAGSDGDVIVNVNGVSHVRDAGKLLISGNGGDDKIHIDLPDSYAHWLITIHGGGGSDAITGSPAAERIIAGDGNDTVVANGGRDSIYAEGGDDSVRG